MNDLLQDLIRRAESSGGAEWLRRCLEQPPLSTVSQTGSSAQEVSRAAVWSSYRSDAAPLTEEDRGRSRRSRRRVRSYSPPPSSQRRGPIPAASRPGTSSERKPPTAVEVQRDLPSSAASLGEPLSTVFPNSMNNPNMALLSQFMTQMCQFFNNMSPPNLAPGVASNVSKAAAVSASSGDTVCL